VVLVHKLLTRSFAMRPCRPLVTTSAWWVFLPSDVHVLRYFQSDLRVYVRCQMPPSIRSRADALQAALVLHDGSAEAVVTRCVSHFDKASSALLTSLAELLVSQVHDMLTVRVASTVTVPQPAPGREPASESELSTRPSSQRAKRGASQSLARGSAGRGAAAMAMGPAPSTGLQVGDVLADLSSALGSDTVRNAALQALATALEECFESDAADLAKKRRLGEE
jgi:hypothetical protein